MKIEFTGRLPKQKKLRQGHVIAAAIALLGAALLSGRHLPVPDFQVTPDVLPLTARGLSLPSERRKVTVVNPNAAPLKIASVTVSGQMESFQYTWNGCNGGDDPFQGHLRGRSRLPQQPGHAAKRAARNHNG